MSFARMTAVQMFHQKSKQAKAEKTSLVIIDIWIDFL